jgi:hypothetical protein
MGHAIFTILFRKSVQKAPKFQNFGKQMSEAGIAYPSGAPDFLCCALIFD